MLIFIHCFCPLNFSINSFFYFLVYFHRLKPYKTKSVFRLYCCYCTLPFTIDHLIVRIPSKHHKMHIAKPQFIYLQMQVLSLVTRLPVLFRVYNSYSVIRWFSICKAYTQTKTRTHHINARKKSSRRAQSSTIISCMYFPHLYPCYQFNNRDLSEENRVFSLSKNRPKLKHAIFFLILVLTFSDWHRCKSELFNSATIANTKHAYFNGF